MKSCGSTVLLMSTGHTAWLVNMVIGKVISVTFTQVQEQVQSLERRNLSQSPLYYTASHAGRVIISTIVIPVVYFAEVVSVIFATNGTQRKWYLNRNISYLSTRSMNSIYKYFKSVSSTFRWLSVT